MAPQRKYRSDDEREAIVENIKKEMVQVGLEPIPPQFAKVLGDFLKSAGGYIFQGTIDLPERGVAIDYQLPGRRITPPGARIRKLATDPAPPLQEQRQSVDSPLL